MVDGKAIRNRSHAIEMLIARGLGTSVEGALVLAGGGGATKAMTKVNGKPVIARAVDWLTANGARDIVFSIDAKGKKIRNYFGEGFRYIEEKRPLGTGGSIAAAASLFKGTFIVCYGDVLADFDLRSMVSFHKRNKATVTVALTSVKDTEGVGIATLDGARITGFAEKPADAKTTLANAGIYVMEPGAFAYLSSAHSLERDALPKLIAAGKCFGYPFSGPWADIARKGGKEKAKRLFK